ncbi:MAG TPA: glycosyltransferase family 39 protein [Chloroflexia bacterium]|nr:glycosyltransferase family 39 protein [Chloroflexia bacterium]
MKLRLTGNNSDKLKLRYLDAGLALLALLAYIIYLTGNYFLPVPGVYALLVVLLLLVCGVAARLYLTYHPGVLVFRQAMVKGWPLLILLLAVLVGGFLRFQAIRTAGDVANQPEAIKFAQSAQAIINTSDWQPKSFTQPPLYLYLAAGVSELQFVQQASAGKINSPEGLKPVDISTAVTYVNLLLGLLTLVAVWAGARLFWRTEIAGIVAALLLATSWLAYQGIPRLEPQFLAAFLLSLSFYFIAQGCDTGKLWDYRWAGFFAGLATAAAYSSILLLLLLGLSLFILKQEGSRVRLAWNSGLAFLLGLTLAAPGWLLSLQFFIPGLVSIGKAPGDAAGFYFKQALTNDAGLVMAFGVTLLLAFVLRESRLWLALIMPLLYALLVCVFGPALVERLVLITPLVAISGAFPVVWAARKGAEWLEKKRGRAYPWLHAGLTLALTVGVILVSVLVRRFF